MKGLLLVDKPAGMTSHDVVDHIRKATGLRRVGHTGTLDPRATGLLILCLGGATRLSEHLTGLDKVYEGSMRFGMITESYDLDGAVVENRAVPDLAIECIQEACNRYTGKIEQVPPMVSAVKVGGERLYKLARHGETIERKPRPVTVHEFRVLAYTPPDARIRVRCTSGTYVRSLCHDVGAGLGCGAVLAELRRTWVGPHCVDNAASLETLSGREAVLERIIAIDNALDLPAVVVRAAFRGLVLSGGNVIRVHCTGEFPASSGWVQLKAENGELLALGTVKSGPHELYIHSQRVLTD